MTLQTNDCTAANCAAEAPQHIQAQFDLLMDTARSVCSDFVGMLRGDGCWVFVPVHRHGASTAKNLMTVQTNSKSLRLRIIQNETVKNRLERFELEHLTAYRQRLAAREQCLSAL